MTLVACAEVSRGTCTLDVAVRVAGGETVAVVGPNGSGKSTLLDAVAGLVPVSGGRIVIGGRVVDGPGVRVPAHERRVAVVPQDHCLFPHLSVRDNVAFGLRCMGMPRGVARDRAQEWLERLDLPDVGRARPHELSGGEAQRVALARALAAKPQVLLLDEPLSSLDAQTRIDARTTLRRHLADFAGATVLVTHDALDAVVLAGRAVALDSGRVAESGAVLEMFARPGSPYVAALAGLNFFRGIGDGTAVRGAEGFTVTGHRRITGPAVAVFRPGSVTVHGARPSGSARNVWPVRLGTVEPRGELVRVTSAGEARIAADVTLLSAATLELRPGEHVWFAVKATEVDVAPA